MARTLSSVSSALCPLYSEHSPSPCLPVFVDAPHVLKPVDLVWNTNRLEELGLRAEVQANEETIEAEADPSLTPRAWYKPNPERTRAVGIEEGLMSLKEVLQNNRFDVSS